MLKFFKLILLMAILTNMAWSDYCTSDYNCSKKINKKTRVYELQCILPNIKTLKINAKNVFNAEGNLKKYWDGKTACDVLGWMNTAVDHIDPNYNGLSTAFTQTMDLEFKSLQKNIGGITGKTEIKFDSDRPYLLDGTNDGSSNFHWLRMHFIVVHEFSHFIEKNSQPKTHSGIPKWVEEGRAKDFEDIVYDSENPYRDVFTSYKMYEQGIANVLNDGGLTKYDYPNFAFFKALRNKCGHIEMGLLTNNKPDLKQATDGCTDIPTVGEDDLAGLFTLYNWAMLYKQDLSLLDANEPARPNDKIFDGEYKKIDEKGFTGSIDIKSKIGTSIMAPFSAKSFLITHETLQSEGDMNLTFKSSGDLKLVAVRVKTDGSSDNVNNNFVMDSSTQSYKLTELDRAGGLFVTLVNTTGGEVRVDELKLVRGKKFFGSINLLGRAEAFAEWEYSGKWDYFGKNYYNIISSYIVLSSGSHRIFSESKHSITPFVYTFTVEECGSKPNPCISSNEIKLNKYAHEYVTSRNTSLTSAISRFLANDNNQFDRVINNSAITYDSISVNAVVIHDTSICTDYSVHGEPNSNYGGNDGYERCERVIKYRLDIYK